MWLNELLMRMKKFWENRSKKRELSCAVPPPPPRAVHSSQPILVCATTSAAVEAAGQQNSQSDRMLPWATLNVTLILGLIAAFAAIVNALFSRLSATEVANDVLRQKVHELSTKSNKEDTKSLEKKKKLLKPKRLEALAQQKELSVKSVGFETKPIKHEDSTHPSNPLYSLNQPATSSERFLKTALTQLSSELDEQKDSTDPLKWFSGLVSSSPTLDLDGIETKELIAEVSDNILDGSTSSFRRFDPWSELLMLKGCANEVSRILEIPREKILTPKQRASLLRYLGNVDFQHSGSIHYTINAQKDHLDDNQDVLGAVLGLSFRFDREFFCENWMKLNEPGALARLVPHLFSDAIASCDPSQRTKIELIRQEIVTGLIERHSVQIKSDCLAWNVDHEFIPIDNPNCATLTRDGEFLKCFSIAFQKLKEQKFPAEVLNRFSSTTRAFARLGKHLIHTELHNGQSQQMSRVHDMSLIPQMLQEIRSISIEPSGISQWNQPDESAQSNESDL